MNRTLKSLTELLEDIRCARVPLADILVLINDPAPIIRVNALRAIARDYANEATTVATLKSAAESDENRALRLAGQISVAFEAVRFLKDLENTHADSAVARLIRDWPEPARTDLIWYLQKTHGDRGSMHNEGNGESAALVLPSASATTRN